MNNCQSYSQCTPIHTFPLPVKKSVICKRQKIKLRRYSQLNDGKNKISKKEIEKSLIKRDYNDINRKISPLVKANDSIEVDTTAISIKKQVDLLYKIILNKEANDK